jgi:general secretion pathway protein D
MYGTRREGDTIEAMLRKIDILPLQVRIDAVIAEVQLNDNLQYGTQFFFKSGGLNGILSNATQSTAVTPTLSPSQAQLNLSFPGFFIGGHGQGGAPFAINALQAVTKVNVLSSPELLVLDNQPARLQVGNVVPYLTQSSQSLIVANAPVVNSINYQQTGVVMEVTPRVNSGGLVTLDILQDVSDVSNIITTPGINSPTFDDRNVTSRVVVQDGQTVGLAGLIRDNASTNNQGIPWLKDVPLLGFLAGNQNNTRQRTELLILITPHVMHDQRDALALTEDLREQVINAAAVPDTLNGLRPSGSPDPGARLRQKLKLQQ